MTNPAENSAILYFPVPGLPQLALILEAYGDPEHIRQAMRRACSRRRTIIKLRPSTFFCNLVHHLVAHGLDITTLSNGPHRSSVKYLYALEVVNGTPFIRFGSQGEWHLEDPVPVQQFLGWERRLMSEEEKTKRRQEAVTSGKKRGRPSQIKRNLKARGFTFNEQGEAIRPEGNLAAQIDPSEDPANFLPVGERPAWLQEIINKETATQPNKRKPRKIVKD